jgi:hypothetical protein
MSWIALRPLKLTSAIETPLPVNRSTLCAAIVMTRSADSAAHVTVMVKAKGLFIGCNPNGKMQFNSIERRNSAASRAHELALTDRGFSGPPFLAT